MCHISCLEFGKRALIGKNEVENAGIRIQYFPYTKGISSTKIKNKIRGGAK